MSGITNSNFYKKSVFMNRFIGRHYRMYFNIIFLTDILRFYDCFILKFWNYKIFSFILKRNLRKKHHHILFNDILLAYRNVID